MKIRSIETFTNEFVCLVRVTAGDGAQGWGQTAPCCADITATVLHRQVAPWALGMDCTDIDAMADFVRDREHKFPGAYLRRAIGGVDTALWDMRGKREGLPVCALIGGTPGRVRACASSMKRDITPGDEAARLVQLQDRQGFDAFRFRVRSGIGRTATNGPAVPGKSSPRYARRRGTGWRCWATPTPVIRPQKRSGSDRGRPVADRQQCLAF